MLAALITARLIYGREGLERLYRDMFKWRVGAIWWAIAVLGPVVALLLTALIVRLMGGPWPDWSLVTKVAEYPALGFLALLVAEILFYGYGEEVGWRGFALPHLQKRYSALWASVILSVFWALWHLPLLITNESYRQMNPLMLLGWYLSMLTGSILTTWLYNSTRGSLLLLALFHAVLDLAMINQALNLQMVNLMGMLTTLWGLAVIFAVLRGPKAIWETPERGRA
jgi:membrane protease YdiL (CAAX protease family)